MLTNGYDYAFALSRDEVNAILAQNLQSKTVEVKYNTTDPDSQSTITMDFTLSPWEIVSGGSGTLLNVSLPVKEGYLEMEGGALPSGSFDLTGVSVIIQIELGWLGTGDQQQASGSGNTDHLIFSPSTTQKGNPGYVSEVNILDPDGQLNTIAKGILSTTVVDALIADKKTVQYIFADINPTPGDVGTWLKPAKWQYYYVDSKTGPSALCFLCQLSDKAFPPQPTFDANNLDSANNSLLLISQEVFFRNVVLPGIQSSFPGAGFSVSVNPEEAVTISNTGGFTVGKVQASHFSVTTSNQGDGLTVNASGGGSLKFLFGLAKLPGASYSWSVQATNPLQFSSPNLTFQEDKNPTVHHDQTIHWYDWVLLAVIGITDIAGVVSFILDEVNDFYDDSASMGVGNINTTLQNSIDGSVVNLKNLISWNKPGESFSPAASGLQVSLYVRGNLS